MNFSLSGSISQLAGAAIIAGAALALTPRGKVQNVLKLICGIYLVCLIIGSVAQGNFALSSYDISEYRAQAESLVNDSLNEKSRLERTVIEDELRAYILDKGIEMKADISDVDLEMKWCAEGEYWYPVSVKIIGEFSEYEKVRIESFIETEIGISRENQVWSEDNG